MRVVRLLLLSIAVVCAPVVVAPPAFGSVDAGSATALGVTAGTLADATGDAGAAGHDHGGGLSPSALLERLLHAGPVAAPFVMISTVMLVANRRANRLHAAARAG